MHEVKIYICVHAFCGFFYVEYNIFFYFIGVMDTTKISFVRDLAIIVSNWYCLDFVPRKSILGFIEIFCLDFSPVDEEPLRT